jgi:hypothetical protein
MVISVIAMGISGAANARMFFCHFVVGHRRVRPMITLHDWRECILPTSIYGVTALCGQGLPAFSSADRLAASVLASPAVAYEKSCIGSLKHTRTS